MDTKELTAFIGILGEINIERLVSFGLAFLALLAAVRLITRVSTRLSVRFPTRRLLILQFQATIVFFLYIFVGGFIVYLMLVPAKELLIALGGGAAVAIGLSLKDFVASLFSGLILLFERPFQVGDRVQFGDSYGEITSIGLRSVRLQTLDDSTVTIPNSLFMSASVSSGNAGALDMMIVIPFYVALDADLDKAYDLLYETVVTSRFVYLKKPVTIVASEIGIAEKLAVRLEAKSYVLDVIYEQAFQTDVVMRASRAFKEVGIKRPRVTVDSFI
jgi:small-conductance mechanosensitive channel